MSKVIGFILCFLVWPEASLCSDLLEHGSSHGFSGNHYHPGSLKEIDGRGNTHAPIKIEKNNEVFNNKIIDKEIQEAQEYISLISSHFTPMEEEKLNKDSDFTNYKQIIRDLEDLRSFSASIPTPNLQRKIEEILKKYYPEEDDCA